MTIVEAPSGFGKTTAIADWARTRPDTTAWLSLTAEERLPEQLLQSIASALLRLYPLATRLAAGLRRAHDGKQPFHSTIEAIITALPEGPPTVLVIDDAHLASQAALLDIAVPLARYSAGRLRLVVSGTKSISRWLMRELAAHVAHRLRPSEFAFTLKEIERLAAQSVDDPQDAGRRLWEETQGWPIAVQLLLQTDYCSGPLGWDSSAPYVLTDYIESEVIGSLPADLRTFVLDATVTDRVCPSLTAYVTGDAHSPALLNECRSRGLFLDVVQNGSGEMSLRWQSTFAQSCREIAKRTDPERYDRNQRRTAEWMVSEYPSEAVFHSLQVSDPEFAVRMLENVWLQMITGGGFTALETYCLDVSIDQREFPSLLYIRACCRVLDGDIRGAQMLRDRADSAAAKLSGDQAERTRITRCFAEVISLDGREELLDALSEVEELLRSSELSRSLYIHGMFLLGWSHLKLRQKSNRSIELLSAAARSAEKTGFTTIAARASATHAAALTLSGQFSVARVILDDLLQGVDEPNDWDPFHESFNHWSSAFIDVWQGNLERAIVVLRRLDETIAPAPSDIGLARMYFAYAAALIGDPKLIAEAERMLTRISSEERFGLPWHVYKRVAATCLLYARGERKEAIETLSSLGDEPGATTTRAVAAALWRRLGMPDRAMAVIKQIDPALLVSYSAASVHFTRAVVAWGRDAKKSAHACLEQSLDAGAPEGVTTPYMRMSEVERDLLLSHMAWGTKHASFITARLTADRPRVQNIGGPTAVLSERELDVYGFLGTSMTAEEIAGALFLSPATVRSHQRSIYRKLGVTNRRDAVRAGL